jgi:hypothetical protein
VKPLYLLCPGHVISKRDGQLHYVGAMRLALLYGVDWTMCEIDNVPDWWPASMRQQFEERTKGLIKLAPRCDGNYTLPQQQKA